MIALERLLLVICSSLVVLDDYNTFPIILYLFFILLIYCFHCQFAHRLCYIARSNGYSTYSVRQ